MRAQSFVILCVLYVATSLRFGNQLGKPSAKRIFHQSFELCAKKKSPKLVSDDFLSSLKLDDEEESADTSTNNKSVAKDDGKKKPGPISNELLSSIIENENEEDKKSKKKRKKKSKGLDFSNLSGTDDDAEEEANTEAVEEPIAEQIVLAEDGSLIIDENAAKKKDKKKKKNKGGLDFPGLSDDDAEDDDDTEDDSSMGTTKSSTPEITLEQKVRKEKPSARVRFIESSQPDFVSLGLNKVSLMYGNTVILKDASFSCNTGDRIGLVGPNGCGKSTQLKILAGEIEATTGEVLKSSSSLRVSFLRQEFIDELVMTRTLKEELLSSFKAEKKILEEIAECEEEVGQTTDDPEKMNQVLDRLQKLQDQAISKGVYSLESRVLKVMDSMGFTGEDGNALVSSFSGGWKMRIGLAKILLQDPNVLLLDEPTNHMDLDSVIWLESFLQQQSIPMIIVSHDREFLDRVCNKIVDVEDGTTVSYDGNYSNFLKQKRVRLELWKEKYDRQTRFVKEEEKMIKKLKNDPNAAQQVRAKEQSLERLKNSDEWLEPPPKDKKFRFRFPPAPRCGENVLEVNKLGHGYGEGKYKTLFKDVDFFVDRGNRVGFIGPNGSGKSTMMRLIYGSEEPKSGFVEMGSTSVEANYYAQNQADALDLDKTILETVQEDAPSDVSLTDIRGLLGQFMFKGDDANKKIRMLSGGEKARVALCKMMLTPANLLLLDEPTNHLDITSKEVLEDALLNYAGSVLIISHDRYFMSQVANTIFSFNNKTVERFDCDYHDFMEQHSEEGGLKDKVEARYVAGDKYKITNAKEVVIPEEKDKKKRNFGGSGVTSGNLFKGIKNAKRYAGK